MVLVALLLVATVASATGLSAWRSMRAARLAWNGERAAQAADEAIARVIATWDAESFAARMIGERWAASVNTTSGGPVSLSLVRSAPVVLVIEASSTSRVSGSPDTASRRVARVVSLHAPPLPLHGALTVFGGLDAGDGATVDGRDLMWATDGCGTTRDTTSAPGVYAGVVTAAQAASISGRPAVVALGAGSALGETRGAFQSAFSLLDARIRRRQVLVAPAALSVGTPWTARTVTSGDSLLPGQVTLTGSSSHDGLLVVDGDLQLQGALRVDGLLVVSGALDASGGTLDVNGAVIVGDAGARGTLVGTNVRVRYSPCLTGRALATVARPSIAPFALWIAR